MASRRAQSPQEAEEKTCAGYGGECLMALTLEITVKKAATDLPQKTIPGLMKVGLGNFAVQLE